MNIEAIRKSAERAINEKVFPGAVVGVVTRDGTRTLLPFGQFTYEADSPQVTENTIFDVASVTKSVATGSLALMLIDEGKLKITDKLIDYLPEFKNSDRENVLIKHLLTYTIDGYGLASLKTKNSTELFHALLTHDFAQKPGTTFRYTNIPAALLGLVIEKICNDTLDNLAAKHFFLPLNMLRTTYYPEHFGKNEIAPTEIDDWRGLVHGVVHDESAFVCKQDGKIVGHAGLFSTAPDLLCFLEMLLNKGTIGGRKYFSQEIIAQMGTNQIPELNDVTGLAWELFQPRYMGRYAGPHTFGKTGFTGTLCVCDGERGIAYVILSNRTFPKRQPDSRAINSFRAEIGNSILGEG